MTWFEKEESSRKDCKPVERGLQVPYRTLIIPCTSNFIIIESLQILVEIVVRSDPGVPVRGPASRGFTVGPPELAGRFLFIFGVLLFRV